MSGASLSPCDETYEGPAPFSEVETKSLADYICSRNDTIKSYMNIHTYSEDWMYSFGNCSRHRLSYGNDCGFIGDVQGHYPDDVNILVRFLPPFSTEEDIFASTTLSCPDEKNRIFIGQKP